MATLTYVKYQTALANLPEAANSGTDAWKLILSNTAPTVASDVTQANANELTTVGGYTVGGVACSITSHAQSAGTYKLVLAAPASPTWTGSGAGFTFRYVILWNSTQNQLYAYWDRTAATTVNAGDTYTPTLDAVNGTFTIA
jgi:hypothetical protein